jgi:SulP family sulfate permease
MAVTFCATLTISLEVAILVGVLVSLLIYLNWARHPQVVRVVPDPRAQRRFRAPEPESAAVPAARHAAHRRRACFFGSVEHIRDEIEAAREGAPRHASLLLIGTGVNLIDNAGAELLAWLTGRLRESGVNAVSVQFARRRSRCSNAAECSTRSAARPRYTARRAGIASRLRRMLDAA